MREKIDDKTLQEAHILLHPIRYRIVELLAEKPMHINEISRVMGDERRFVTYHLRLLEECGFLSSKYKISPEKKSKGKSLKIYKTTERVEQTISKLREQWTK
ncbi:MAG: winged helix-turn-helix transcriptional regulator [Methanophagales archaeon]|nr:winged helix-turn-helix transcriptional regulator [Methanophagales archaeon]